MPDVTIGNLPEEENRAHKVCFAQQGPSNETETHDIFEAAVSSSKCARLGSALSALSQGSGLQNADIDAIQHAGDTKPATPMTFE